MSNKAINFIFGSSGFSFCLRSLGFRKTAPGRHLDSLGDGGPGPWTTTFHTYFPNASTERPAPYFLAHCLYNIPCPLMWKKNTLLYNIPLDGAFSERSPNIPTLVATLSVPTPWEWMAIWMLQTLGTSLHPLNPVTLVIFKGREIISRIPHNFPWKKPTSFGGGEGGF